MIQCTSTTLNYWVTTSGFTVGPLVLYKQNGTEPDPEEPDPEYFPTFEEVSYAHLNQYGEPDIIDDQGSDVYWTWNLGDKMLTVHFWENLIGYWKVISEEYWVSFAQVTQPYLDQYGEPDDIHDDQGHAFHYVWYLENSIFVAIFTNVIDGIPTSSWRMHWESFFYSFEYVSQPYLDKYGPVEYIYTRSDGLYIEWWWYMQGFMVSFSRGGYFYHDIYSWKVWETDEFPPI
ncbi:hypothetical protein ES703_116294 [subsurface metagenome]